MYSARQFRTAIRNHYYRPTFNNWSRDCSRSHDSTVKCPLNHCLAALVKAFVYQWVLTGRDRRQPPVYRVVNLIKIKDGGHLPEVNLWKRVSRLKYTIIKTQLSDVQWYNVLPHPVYCHHLSFPAQRIVQYSNASHRVLDPKTWDSRFNCLYIGLV